MKRRLPPGSPKSVRDAEFVTSARVDEVVRGLVAHGRGERAAAPSLWQFCEDDVARITREVERQLKHPLDEVAYVRAMRKTQRSVAYPRENDIAVDTWYMLSQPEISERFWPEWNPRTGSRGANPGIYGKALLTTTATARHSAHFEANNYLLKHDRGLLEVFRSIEEMSAIATGRQPNPLKIPSYEQAMKQVAKVAPPVYSAALRANIEIAQAIHELVPNSFRWLAMDGTSAKAWVPQVGRQDDPAAEMRVRRHAQKAGARLVERDGFKDFWRGWYFVVLVDVVSGLPVAWVVWDAAVDEARALKHLLYVLYENWPDCPAEAIAADGAWDENWAVAWCLVNYGLHLVAPRSERRDRAEHPLSRFESEWISKYNGVGQLFCREHGIPMIRDGAQLADRRGLAPGEPSDEHVFRIRAHCPRCDEARRVSLKMNLNWQALSYYPHCGTAGMPDLHAFRIALAARRNGSETLNSALKVSKNLGLGGANRTRTSRETTVEALLSLSLLMKTAFIAAAVRIEAGLQPEAPPPPLDKLLAA